MTKELDKKISVNMSDGLTNPDLNPDLHKYIWRWLEKKCNSERLQPSVKHSGGSIIVWIPSD